MTVTIQPSFMTGILASNTSELSLAAPVLPEAIRLRDERLDAFYNHALLMGHTEPQVYAEQSYTNGSAVAYASSKHHNSPNDSKLGDKDIINAVIRAIIHPGGAYSIMAHTIANKMGGLSDEGEIELASRLDYIVGASRHLRRIGFVLMAVELLVPYYLPDNLNALIRIAERGLHHQLSNVFREAVHSMTAIAHHLEPSARLEWALKLEGLVEINQDPNVREEGIGSLTSLFFSVGWENHYHILLTIGHAAHERYNSAVSREGRLRLKSILSQLSENQDHLFQLASQVAEGLRSPHQDIREIRSLILRALFPHLRNHAELSMQLATIRDDSRLLQASREIAASTLEMLLRL